MSDDLAAKAANWVPPWQRPADGESTDGQSPADADGAVPDGDGAGVSDEAPSEGAAAEASAAGEDEGPESKTKLPGQWDRLSGAKWQTTRPAESAGEADPGDEPRSQELSDPQLSDCVSEDEDDEDLADEEGASWNSQARSEDPPAEVLSGDPGVSGDEAGVEGLSWDDVPAAGSEDGAGRAGGGTRTRGKRAAAANAQPEEGDAVLGQGQLFVPAQRAAEEAPSLSEAELLPALEAILMVVDEPANEIVLAQVLEVPAERVADALLRLSAAYTQEGKGFDLRRAAGGWRFYTRAEYSSYVERFVLDGQQLRLTQASLETLAVVAYKQPVTRSRISAIRGVNCDGVVRTLVTRGLIEECGTEPESGAHLYKTTNLFLEKLGLDSVEQLPPLAPFLPDNLDEVALNE